MLGIPKDADEAAVKKAYRSGLCACLCSHGTTSGAAQTLQRLRAAWRG